MADFDINSHLQQMGFGRGGGKSAGKDGTNEDTIIDPVIEGAAKNVTGLTHLAGLDLNEFGKTGIQSGLESEGIAGKMITPSALPDIQGGFIARLLHAVFLKNRDITDHTQGVSGGANIEGGSGGEGFSGGADFSSLVGNAGSMGDFDWAPASRGDLGNYSPPNVGDAGGAIVIDR
jgi:hypothetical protein